MNLTFSMSLAILFSFAQAAPEKHSSFTEHFFEDRNAHLMLMNCWSRTDNTQNIWKEDEEIWLALREGSQGGFPEYVNQDYLAVFNSYSGLH